MGKLTLLITMQVVQVALLWILVCVEMRCEAIICDCPGERCKLTFTDNQWKWTEGTCEQKNKACEGVGVCYVRHETEVISATSTTPPPGEATTTPPKGATTTPPKGATTTPPKDTTTPPEKPTTTQKAVKASRRRRETPDSADVQCGECKKATSTSTSTTASLSCSIFALSCIIKLVYL